jgi:hypothetical protein
VRTTPFVSCFDSFNCRSSTEIIPDDDYTPDDLPLCNLETIELNIAHLQWEGYDDTTHEIFAPIIVMLRHLPLHNSLRNLHIFITLTTHDFPDNPQNFRVSPLVTLLSTEPFLGLRRIMFDLNVLLKSSGRYQGRSLPKERFTEFFKDQMKNGLSALDGDGRLHWQVHCVPVEDVKMERTSRGKTVKLLEIV